MAPALEKARSEADDAARQAKTLRATQPELLTVVFPEHERIKRVFSFDQ